MIIPSRWMLGLLAAAAIICAAGRICGQGAFTIPVNTCSTPTAAGTSTGVCKVIPHIAVGSFDNNLTKYATTIEIVNAGTAAVTLNGAFYKADGTASTLTFSTNRVSNPTITGGVFNSISLPAGSVMVITGGAASSGMVNWGRIESTASISVSTFFEIRDVASNALVSRVGVSSSGSGMSRLIIPWVRNASSGLDVGFAIVNTSTSSASYTATLKGPNGSVISTKTGSIAPGRQLAQFTREFFALANEPGGTNYGFVVFESTTSSFAAIALAIEGGTQTSFPIDPL